MTILISVLAGFAAGILSGWGIGGGTLLMLYMIYFVKMQQAHAQGINLLFFLPTSAAAIIFHIKNGLIDKSVALPAVMSGVLTSLLSSFAATAMDMSLLKKLFGVFIIIIGISELFGKVKSTGGQG